MKKLEFATVIDADPETVWNTMLTLDTYEKWTTAFCEGSTYKGSWDAGERMRFLAPGGDGMLSVIAENRPFEFLSIKHIGSITNGVDDTESEEVRKWAPSFENYHFTDLGGSTELKVVMDVLPDFEKVMSAMWPKALASLKTLCETSAAASGGR
jgi:hypothetical protein